MSIEVKEVIGCLKEYEDQFCWISDENVIQILNKEGETIDTFVFESGDSL